ncbi:MAG: thermonuclease family protein [Planctomycetes bacterium]|nr:thermonuclease family protein [Planctomycetota bacterium]
MKKIKNTILASLLLLLPAVLIYTVFPKTENVQNNKFSGQVVRLITDGDTIVVTPGLDGEHHIRYLGVDCPERYETLYSKAKDLNKKLVSKKIITLVPLTKISDFYYRGLALVYAKNDSDSGEILVNLKIIEDGLGWFYPKDMIGTELYPKFKEKQIEAIGLKKNIWSEILLEKSAYKDTGNIYFHTANNCNSKVIKSEITIKEAFESCLIPCKKCRQKIWK